MPLIEKKIIPTNVSAYASAPQRHPTEERRSLSWSKLL